MVSIRSHLAKGQVAPFRSAKRHGQPSIFHFPSSILATCTIAALFLTAMLARADERDVQFNRWFAA